MDEDLIRDGIPATPDSEVTLNMHVDGRIGHGAIMRGSQLVIWGGHTKRKAMKEGFLEIDLDTGRKKILKPLLQNDNPIYRSLPDHERPFFATCYSSGAYAVQGNFLYTFGGNFLIRFKPVNYLFYFEFCQDSRQREYASLVDEVDDIGQGERIKWLILHANTWSVPGHPSPRDSHTLFIHNNKAYSFGGYGPSMYNGYLHDHGIWNLDFEDEYSRGWNNQLLVFDLNDEQKLNVQWRNPVTTGNIPCPRAAHAMCVVGSGAYLFGGWSHATQYKDLYHLDLLHLQWTTISLVGVLPSKRMWATLTRLDDGHLFIFGGCDSNSALGDGHILDLKEKSFRRVVQDREITRRILHASVLTNDNRVIVVGGCVPDIINQQQNHVDEFLQFHVYQPTSLYLACLRYCTRNIATYSPEQLESLNSFIRQDIRNRRNHRYPYVRRE